MKRPKACFFKESAGPLTLIGEVRHAHTLSLPCLFPFLPSSSCIVGNPPWPGLFVGASGGLFSSRPSTSLPTIRCSLSVRGEGGNGEGGEKGKQGGEWIWVGRKFIGGSSQ